MQLSKTPSLELLPVTPMGTRVPRIIHQTYRAEDWPSGIAENISRLRAMNPSWLYRFYSDEEAEDFLRTNYGPAIHRLFARIDNRYHAARADLFRYLLLYKVGGVYLDIKSTVDRPLDEIIRDDDLFLISGWHNQAGEQYEGWGIHAELTAIGCTELQQWWLPSCIGHPLLKAAIEVVLQNIRSYWPLRSNWPPHGCGKSGVLRVTGPIAYTFAIYPMLPQYPHRMIDAALEGFRYSIFDSDRSESHRTIMGGHYTQNDTIPIVKPLFYRRLLLQVRKIAKLALRRAVST